MTLSEFTGGKSIVHYDGVKLCFFKGSKPSDDVISRTAHMFKDCPQCVHRKDDHYYSVFYNDLAWDREIVIDGIFIRYKDGEIDVNDENFRQYVKEQEDRRLDDYAIFFFVASSGSVHSQLEYIGDLQQ